MTVGQEWRVRNCAPLQSPWASRPFSPSSFLAAVARVHPGRRALGGEGSPTCCRLAAGASPSRQHRPRLGPALEKAHILPRPFIRLQAGVMPAGSQPAGNAFSHEAALRALALSYPLEASRRASALPEAVLGSPWTAPPAPQNKMHCPEPPHILRQHPRPALTAAWAAPHQVQTEVQTGGWRAGCDSEVRPLSFFPL